MQKFVTSKELASLQYGFGVKIMLDKDTPAIFVGPGGFREAEVVPLKIGDNTIGSTFELKFYDTTESYVLTYWYKNEWMQIELKYAIEEYGRTWALGWSAAAEKSVTNRSKYITKKFLF